MNYGLNSKCRYKEYYALSKAIELMNIIQITALIADSYIYMMYLAYWKDP